jgi:signal transduction histidine kinase
LDNALKEVLAEVEGDIRERGASVNIESPLGVALAHPPALKQVLANLITNGLKFVPPGVSPRLRIFAERNGDSVRLSIEDNGIGIPTEHHQRIFGLFERLHESQTYPGTGIGLALVRKGAERMGGCAGVESAPSQGSRFWVDLPAANREPAR